MKVALVYDRVNKWGGAERVLLALHEIWPDAPLYTSVYDKRLALWAEVFEVRTSFIQNLPLPKNGHEYYPFLMGLAFEQFNFDEFNVVVSITSEFAKAIITKPNTLHICLCLTPTGYLWSNFANYFSGKSWWYKVFALPLVKYLRWYDKVISYRPDKYVAISQVVQRRIKEYYDKKSVVIYPPVNVENTTSNENKGYFLVVSRLVPNKRVDIAVEAFNELGWPLKIVGIGKEKDCLMKMAKDNIEFLGDLTDEQLADYYKNCKALVVPGEEDFGIVAVEAASFGKPVVSFAGGGSLETVVDGKTGFYFHEQSAKSLQKVLKSVVSDLPSIQVEVCRANATRFGKDKFKKDFLVYVEKCWNEYNKR